ncbi:MAG TPA: RagB/SusD family nutrient uptake outer membrane protein, partial [Cyclobacteriaceae bacterium]|nr:RagB/SusD family nutrient uptake outer membrane protein [Cyclobacteriaceae bacterium]
MKKTIYIFIATTVLIFSSCNKDYLNPSSISQQQAVSDVNGLIALANGLQYKFTISRSSPSYTLPSMGGLLAKELLV